MKITADEAIEVIGQLLVDIETAMIREIRRQAECMESHQYSKFSEAQIQLMKKIAEDPTKLVLQTLLNDSENKVLLRQYTKEAGLEPIDWWK